jgi:putative membrane protein (TIGR04086 family)
MKKSGKRQQGQGGSPKDRISFLVKGSVLALTAALTLLLLCAAAVSGGWIGQNSMDRCVTVACVTAAMLGAVVSIKGGRELALPLGIGTGVMLFLMLFTLGLILFEDAPTPDQIPTILCACLCGGAITGILGRKTKKKRRR